MSDSVHTDAFVIVQARMGSRRFPGKVMMRALGEPLIAYLLDSLLRVCSRDSIVLATSTEKENDQLVAFCEKREIEVFRGEETNVARRFYSIAQDREEDFFVRISGDSPLLDHRLIELAVRLCLKNRATVASTAVGRLVPSGMNVEVVHRGTFIDQYSHFSTPEHFEHPTQFFYESLDQWNICSVDPGVAVEDRVCKFSVDTPQDLQRIEKILQRMNKPHWMYTLAEKIDLYKIVLAEI